MRTVTRVKRHIIKPNHELYPVILETSKEVAKLRNRVNYLAMQNFVKEYDKDPSQFVIEFRNQIYRDYYEEDKYSHLHFTNDLEARLAATVDTLRAQYRHPQLQVYPEIGEKGHCWVTVRL